MTADGHSEHDTPTYERRPSEAFLDLGGGYRTYHDTGEVPAINPEAIRLSAQQLRDKLDRDDRDAMLESAMSTAADIGKLSTTQRALGLDHIRTLREGIAKPAPERKVVPPPNRNVSSGPTAA